MHQARPWGALGALTHGPFGPRVILLVQGSHLLTSLRIAGEP